MFGRDSKGNTLEEKYDLFEQWLDKQCTIPKLFDEAPDITYSDLVICHVPICDEAEEYYADVIFDLWNKHIYQNQ